MTPTAPTCPESDCPAPLAAPLWKRILWLLETLFFRILAVIGTLWAFGALWFDFPGGPITAWTWLVLCLGGCVATRRKRWRPLVWPAFFFVVWLPWLCIRPSNQRDWAPEYAQTPQAEILGDVVVFKNVRNFDYKKSPGAAAGEFTQIARWENRKVRLSELRGIDMFINYWGSPWMAHPIVSFDFGPDGHLAFSIETRRERTETYTALGGLYKLYELSYLVGDESDLVRVRSHFRAGEDVFLYRLAVRPEKLRERFMEYVKRVNQLHERPEFYDIFLANCTTSIRAQLAGSDRRPLNWRLLANGKMDELLHARGAFVGPKDLDFPAWKKAAHIDPSKVDATDVAGFYNNIRAGRPGFDVGTPAK